MCIYSPMPHTLSYCALIGKCALIRSNTVVISIPIKNTKQSEKCQSFGKTISFSLKKKIVCKFDVFIYFLFYFFDFLFFYFFFFL